MLLRDSQCTFSGGEVTPALWGRTDIQKYKSALRTARNVQGMPQGGVRNRPGTQYIATAADSTHAVRIIPFVASVSQAYVIELGHEYARFYTQDSQVNISQADVAAWVTATNYQVGNYVLQNSIIYYCLVDHTSGVFATDLANGDWQALSIYQIPTPYQGTDLFNIKITQSADVLYLAHPSYAPRTLTFNAGANWVLSLYVFNNGPFMVQNTDKAKTLTPSASDNNSVQKTIAQVISVSISANNDGVRLRTSTAHGMTTGDLTTVSGLTGTLALQLNGNTYVVSVVDDDQVDLMYQNTLTPVIYSGNSFGSYIPAAGTMSAPAASPPTLTANFPLFEAGHAGALFELVATIPAYTKQTAGLTTNNFSLTPIQAGDTWSIITGGNWSGRIFVQVSTDLGTTWITVQSLQSSGTDNFETSGETGVSQCLLRVIGDTTVAFSGNLSIDLTAASFDWRGVVKIVSVTSSSIAVMNIVTPEGLGNDDATFQWSEGSWSTLRGWPTAVTFYQDRLTWGGTETEPQTGWCTKTASYNDFGISAPIEATDGFSFVLPGRQLNAIQSLVVMPQFLVALTNDSEWSISPANGGVFSSTSIDIQFSGHRGSSAIDPVLVGNELILIQQMGTVVRNLIFQLSVNNFFGDNISIASQHLFTGYNIVEMTYQQEPDSIVWMVRDDGTLISLTYIRDQEMSAFTHHDTNGGLFESVTCIPNSTLGINELWLVINRNGTRFIEVLKPRDQGTAPEDQWFVDSGLEYDGAPATVISGLDHLNGYQVAILADGFVVANPNDPQLPVVTVVGGQITLSIAASKVVVGIPIVWDVALLDIETQSQVGSLQGKRVLIPRAKIRIWNSRGGYISTTDPVSSTGIVGYDAIPDILLRDPSTDMDTPLPLVTGIADAPIDSGYDYSAHVCLRGIDPVPFSLLDVICVLMPGGE